MEQTVTYKIPAETLKSPKRAAPQSDIAEIREMFRELDQRYMVYQPTRFYLFLKRAFDITASLLFIVLVMSWLFPIVALLIKLGSKGPVFFIQKRTGYKGVEFDCYKFRTMYVNDEADTVQATYHDKRITRIGKFLRASHIDETAQLFNVLLGDMSIVGPRPHMLYHTRFYGQRIPYYNLRHEVQPGLTGMAQVKGYIGEINVERELRKRIQWDVYYLKNRGIALDVQILASTAWQVLLKVFSIFKKQD